VFLSTARSVELESTVGTFLNSLAL
jgi:hypothetical protein